MKWWETMAMLLRILISTVFVEIFLYAKLIERCNVWVFLHSWTILFWINLISWLCSVLEESLWCRSCFFTYFFIRWLYTFFNTFDWLLWCCWFRCFILCLCLYCIFMIGAACRVSSHSFIYWFVSFFDCFLIVFLLIFLYLFPVAKEHVQTLFCVCLL